RAVRYVRHERQRPNEEERRGFADGAREGEDRPGQDARQSERQNVVPHGLPARRAEGVRTQPDRSGHGADRLLGGNDDHREDEQRERQRGGQHAAAQRHGAHEHREPQDAVDDGGHTREVRDVRPDQRGDAVARRVLHQPDRGGDAERERDHRREHDHPQRADQRRPDPCPGRGARRVGTDELPGQHTRAVPPQVHEQDGEEDEAEDGRGEARRGEQSAEHPAPDATELKTRSVRLDAHASAPPPPRPATPVPNARPNARPPPHSYPSLNRRTTTVLAMFMSSVTANRASPTAKMVRYSMVPNGASPRPTCAMYAVMV